MPLQVVAQRRCLFSADAPVIQNALEHGRDDAFAPVQKRCGNAVRLGIEGDVQGVADKLFGGLTGLGLLQGVGVTDALALQVDELLDGRGAGTDLTHGVQVELEVAVVAPIKTIIRLLAQHDFIDQAGGLRVLRWQPG
ncbi:hypothetical protein D3C72_1821230 [compost metagenome]